MNALFKIFKFLTKGGKFALKTGISVRMFDILDKNKDGKVSWKEFWGMSREDFLTISGEIVARYGYPVFQLFW